jgi:hypothetical protein
MGRGRPKGVKDSHPRTVNTTQKSKNNKGDNGGTTDTNGERVRNPDGYGDSSLEPPIRLPSGWVYVNGSRYPETD